MLIREKNEISEKYKVKFLIKLFIDLVWKIINLAIIMLAITWSRKYEKNANKK